MGDIVSILSVILFSLLGVLFSCLPACLPGVHVYNILGLFVLASHFLAGHGVLPMPEVLIPFFAGLMVGYAMLNTIPSILLSAPDESALFTVLPGRKYLMRGRGYEAVMITALGGVAGLFVLLIIFGLPTQYFFMFVRKVLSPHFHWIIWCVIGFMLMSEWPKGGTRGMAGWYNFFDAWRSIGIGLITFVLSGLLGFILFYRSPVSVNASFQNLMPAFIGLFTLPGLIMNLAGKFQMPKQTYQCSVDGGCDALLHGTVAGSLGGGFAAFFPVITGGVGGFLAGHATSIHDDRSFLISQGVSKLIYYVGGFIFLFVPGVNMMRGGAASMMSGLYVPYTKYDYYMVLAAVAIAGACAYLLMSPLTKFVLKLIGKFGHNIISIVAALVVFLVVVFITGWAGVLIMLTATGIGLLPVLFGARRMNCLGIILLPVACMMSGCGAAVATWLGLL